MAGDHRATCGKAGSPQGGCGPSQPLGFHPSGVTLPKPILPLSKKKPGLDSGDSLLPPWYHRPGLGFFYDAGHLAKAKRRSAWGNRVAQMPPARVTCAEGRKEAAPPRHGPCSLPAGPLPKPWGCLPSAMGSSCPFWGGQVLPWDWLSWPSCCIKRFPSQLSSNKRTLPPSPRPCGPLTRYGGCWSECSSWIWISGQGGSLGFGWGEREGPGWGEAPGPPKSQAGPLAPFSEEGGHALGHQGVSVHPQGVKHDSSRAPCGALQGGAGGISTWRAPSAGGAGAVIQPCAVDEGVALV